MLSSRSICSMGISSSFQDLMNKIGEVNLPMSLYDSQWLASRKAKKNFMMCLVYAPPNRWRPTSEMEVKVFYNTIPLTSYWLLSWAQELIATAPPKLRPNTIKGRFLWLAWAIAEFKMAIPSFLIPCSEGLPSLSEQPRQATIMTSEQVFSTKCLMKGSRVPMSEFAVVVQDESFGWLLLLLLEQVPAPEGQIVRGLHLDVPVSHPVLGWVAVGVGVRGGGVPEAGDVSIMCSVPGMQIILDCSFRMASPKSRASVTATLVLGCYLTLLRMGPHASVIFSCIVLLISIQRVSGQFGHIQWTSLNILWNRPLVSMQKEKTPSKPTFSEPPDNTINDILSTIHRQEEHIQKILSKYSSPIVNPDDTIADNLCSSGPATARVRNGPAAVGRTGRKSNQSTSNQIRDASTLSQSPRKPGSTKPQAKGSKKNSINLPALPTRPTNKQKDQYQLQYEDSDRKYNENVIKFYEGLGGRRQDESRLSKEGRIAKATKGRKKKEYPNLIEQSNLFSQKQGVKNIKKLQNIFDPEQQNEAEISLGLEHQIAQPIGYRPYAQVYNEKQTTGSSGVGVRVDEDEKPTQVSMSYYIRSFNQKWRQQCQEEINYLYFSKGDENDSNKQWAAEAIRMFDKHDQDIALMHKNMKYLDSFDEGFFTAAIYNGNPAGKGL